jgi:ATP-dependent Clp protease ATP-binding subunit ClpC
LGLLSGDQAAAGGVLEDNGITTALVRAQIQEWVGWGEEPVEGHIPLTPRAKKALDLAVVAADRSGRAKAGTAELLLGLLQDDGMATRILIGGGAAPDRMRADITRRRRPAD